MAEQRQSSFEGLAFTERRFVLNQRHIYFCCVSDIIPASSPLPNAAGVINLNLVFSNAWQSFKKNWVYGLLAYVIVVAVLLGGFAAGVALMALLDTALKAVFQDGQKIEMGQKLMVAVWLIFVVLVSPPIVCGLSYFFVEAARGRRKLRNLFIGYSNRWPNLILVFYGRILLIMLGFLCLVLPGIYLAICFLHADSLVLDQKLNFFEALELNRRRAHPNWLYLFIILLVPGVIAPIGLLLCCIGIYLTYPLAMLAMFFLLAECYRQIFPEFETPVAESI